MAIYRCAINKEGITANTRGHSWRNIYDVEAGSYDDALAAADVIRAFEQPLFTSDVQFTTVTAHAVTEPPRRVGAQLAVNSPGGRDPADLGEVLPLWNVARIDYLDTGIGRPERKYYRLPLYSANVVGLELSSELRAALQAMADNIVGLTNYVGPSGEGHSSALVVVPISMRQLGWHRRKRPGFVRGYIPV